MKIFIKLLSVAYLVFPLLSNSMQLSLADQVYETHGIKWKRDNFGNIWPQLDNTGEPNQLSEQLQNLVVALSEQEKGNAFLIHLPHEDGQKTVAIKKAGFKLHHADDIKTEWVIKNGSPIPYATTAIGGARVVVRNQDKVLVVEDKNMRGRMIFPGGSVDAQELVRNTACRELEEETGLVTNPELLKLIALSNRVRANRYGYSDYCHYFLTDNASGTIKPQESEISQVLWVSLKDIAQGEPVENLKMSLTMKMIAQHILNKDKNKSYNLPDPRQYYTNSTQKDPDDIMTLELFEERQHMSEQSKM